MDKKRIERNINVRAITPEDVKTIEWLKSVKEPLLKTKFIPINEYDSNVSIEVYDNFVQIISSQHLQGILIDNPDIAKTILQIFEIVWKSRSEKSQGSESVEAPKLNLGA